MTATWNPSRRDDILVEVGTLLDGGYYTGDWVETTETVRTLRVAAKINNAELSALIIEEGQADPDRSSEPRPTVIHELDIEGLQATGDVPLACRWFRVVASGTIDRNLYVTVRAV